VRFRTNTFDKSPNRKLRRLFPRVRAGHEHRQQSTAKHFRKMAGEIRWVAQRMRPREIRRQLLDLAEPTRIAWLCLDCGVPGR
jgi:hypothetical protein